MPFLVSVFNFMYDTADVILVCPAPMQVAALQDDLASANAGQRPGTSGMSAALRQQVLLLQVRKWWCAL